LGGTIFSGSENVVVMCQEGGAEGKAGGKRATAKVGHKKGKAETKKGLSHYQDTTGRKKRGKRQIKRAMLCIAKRGGNGGA